jgi:ATP-dependent RNA helicase DHX37/DHR1
MKQDIMLRQIIASSLIDKVATLSSVQSVLQTVNTIAADKTSAARISKHQYITCITNQLVFIHPSSVLFKANPPPEYVVFTELVQTSKTYMKGVTAINPGWLSNLGRNLCRVEKVLDDPPPRYDSSKDEVRCWARPTYSSSQWQLPLQELRYPVCLDHYKWFARFLLAGDVLPALKRLVDMNAYAAHPSLVTRSWNIKKVNGLVHALSSQGALSRSTLLDAWKMNDRFLYSELELWVKISHRKLFQEVWLVIKDDSSTIEKKLKERNNMESLVPSRDPGFKYNKKEDENYFEDAHENDAKNTNSDEEDMEIYS